MQALFWISLFFLFYTYLGYGLLLLLANALRRQKPLNSEAVCPAVTFVVPVYNEEAVIQQKIENTLALAYPAEKLFFVFVADGCTDNTTKIIARYPQLQLLQSPVRQGKAAAVNRAVQTVQTPVVVLSDANTLVHPQSLLKMTRHYARKNIGGVSGEKRILSQGASAVGFGERLYWRYESVLKRANGDFYTLVGAAGELFSFRTRLFRPMAADTILDDFVLSATVCLRGYRFVYEKEAYGVEAASASLGEEKKRKVRISAGCYQALVRMPALLNAFRHPRLAFQYLSHRVLRWVVCPLALPLLLLSNVQLAVAAGGIYRYTLGLQTLFYAAACLGRLLPPGRSFLRPLLVPSYFVFMVLSQYAGLVRFVLQRQSALWEKAVRDTPAK